MTMPRILIVEDERIFALDLEARLEANGFPVVGTTATADGAVALASSRRPDVILMDIHLDGDRDGISAAREIQDTLQIPVVFLTAYAENEIIARARESLPFGYLVKPCNTRELVATLQIAATRREAELAVQASERRLRLALDAASLGVWEWQPGSGEFTTGGAIDGIFGQRPENVADSIERFIDRFSPSERDTIRRCLFEGASASGIYRCVRADDSEGWIEVHAKVFPEQSGMVVGVVKDITERRQTEARLRQAKVVFDNTDEGIVITDAARRVVSVNPAFRALTASPDADLTGTDADMLVFADPRGASFYTNLAHQPRGAWQAEVLCRRADGTRFAAWTHVSVVLDASGAPGHFVFTLTDVSAIRAVEAQLEYLAHHDPLTGLPNRVLLQDRMQQEIARARRDAGRFALLFIDLDNFKVINDTLGHDAGDTLLRTVAQRLREELRLVDTVARLGGDEFTVVLGRADDTASVALLGHKLLESVSRPMTLGSETVTITASIGVAFFPADGEDSQSLLKAADSAMYHAKGEGRNGLAFYADDMSDRASERLAIDQGLRVALASSQLALHFQPVVELGTGRVVGAEVLLRWHHPVHGMISPARFIPVAEQSSLIEQIGAWVLDAAVRQAREWDAQGLHPFRLAVNVSTRQFVRDGFEKVVRDVIARHGMPNGGLELEITESALQAVDRSRPLLLALRQLGVQLAIDDFGTGFSSLSLLQHLPIDRLKIDRSFISALSERSSSLAIVRAVVGLGHTLGLRVVAEGVETTDQLALLRHTGCEDAQGYYVCHPLPADQFAAWLRGRRV